MTRLGDRLHAHVARLSDEESGSALVEFVFLAVVLMVPLVYLVLTMARVQAGAYATAAASREAGRAFITAESSEAAPARADAAARIAFADQGFENGDVTARCDDDPCLRPDGRVLVVARVVVPLPLVPSFVRSAVPLQVPISTSHLVTVDRYRGAR